MVGSTSSLRSFSLSLAADHAAGPGRILKGATAASVLVPFPRRIAWTSRAVRNLNCALARPGLMPVHPRDGNNNNSNNNETDSLSSGRPASDSSPAAPAGAAHPTAATTSSVPVLAITFGAVGGIVALAVVLALVYVRRIRRRVKSMKRRTNVLGPGARFMIFVSVFFRNFSIVSVRDMLTLLFLSSIFALPLRTRTAVAYDADQRWDAYLNSTNDTI